jgi:hypothetical protein
MIGAGTGIVVAIATPHKKSEVESAAKPRVKIARGVLRTF